MDSKASEARVVQVTCSGTQMELIRLLDGARQSIMEKDEASIRFNPGDDPEVRVTFAVKDGE